MIMGICVCMCVCCLRIPSFLHYHTHFNVTFGHVWGCPLVVHLEIIFKSVHRFCCCYKYNKLCTLQRRSRQMQNVSKCLLLTALVWEVMHSPLSVHLSVRLFPLYLRNQLIVDLELFHWCSHDHSSQGIEGQGHGSG